MGIRSSSVRLLIPAGWLALLLGSLAFAAEPSGQQGDAVCIENRFLEVCWQNGTGAFTAVHKPTGRAFLKYGKLPGAGLRATATDIVSERFGKGRALEIPHADGSVDRIMLYQDLPFLLLQTVLTNKGNEEKAVRTVSQADLQIDLDKAPADLRALGTAGLTAPDKHSGSYVFLAVADPQTRNGVVGAWLTHDRGSGVVFSSVEDDVVHINPRIDYGRLVIQPGQKAESEIFAVGWFEDARFGLEDWADLVARYYSIKLRPQIDGYCTWYSSPHGGASDEVHLAELGEFSARELKRFGFDFVQIDDKWQDGQRRNGPAKVFCRHNPRGPYPSGMKKAADHLTSLGLTAGIWFMPFAGDRQDPFFADKQHWFVKGPDGSPYFARWGGTSLDMTHPEARKYLADVARLLAKDWGYKYFKMDGLWTGTATKLLYVNNAYQADDLGEPKFHRPDMTPIEAYRSGLKLVREAAGDDVFLLGCCISQNMRSFGASLGLVDAMRVGPDNGANIDGLKRGPWHGSNRYFLHGRIWYNDPDPVYVRAAMPRNLARLICSWVAVTGQLNVSSEWLPSLPPERIDILKRTLPSHNLKPRPVDLFETELPRIWLLTDNGNGDPRHVVGLFNWDDGQAARIECPLDKLGLPAAEAYVGFDYWANRFVPQFANQLTADLPIASCRVLALRAVADHPQIVSTSRHITQGVVDLASERWDEASAILSGVSRVVAGDPYELRIVVPAGDESWKAPKVGLVESASAAKASLQQDGPRIRATIESPETEEVSWRIHFARGRVDVRPPEPVSGLRADVVYSRVRLTWSGESAESFQVTRQSDGTAKIAEITESTYEDAETQYATAYRYIVRARNWAGQLSEPVAVEVTTAKQLERPPIPPAPDIHISDLKPLQARTGWGKVQRDRSCQGNPLTLAGKKYEKGMGVHAGSLLVYTIPEASKRFVALVGIDEEMKEDPRVSVVFKVFGDVQELGEPPSLLAESPVLCDDTLRTWCFDIELSGRLKQLRLVVEPTEDDNKADHADWVNAGFVK